MIGRKNFLDLLKLFLLVELVIIFVLSLIQINLLFTLGVNDNSLYFKGLEASFYLVPQIFFITSPMGLFFATMILLSDYKKNKRILVLQTLGFSNFQIKKPFIFLAFILMIFNYLLLFTILPKSTVTFKKLQNNIQTENLIKFLETKSLKEIIPKVFYYLENLQDHLLEGVFLLDKRNRTKIFVAKRGFLIEGGIKLEEGFYQELIEKEVKFIAAFDSYIFTLGEKILPQERALYELSIYELKNYSGPDLEKALFILHQKLSLPLYSIIFILMILKFDWQYNYSRNFNQQETSKVWLGSLLTFFIMNLFYFFLQTFYRNPLTLILLYFLGPILLQILVWLLKLQEKNAISNKKFTKLCSRY
jgi:lipopolysaccharide export LptBFGC system permease protein LptF